MAPIHTIYKDSEEKHLYTPRDYLRKKEKEEIKGQRKKSKLLINRGSVRDST